ncbi:MAG TPA: alpha/beta hydrolase [Acidimicrobiales bacterium]|nr:alpha/beta hydrolase [Acidimicrobiales bacterium]
MERLFVVLAVVGLLATLNALRPVVLTPLRIPGFFPGWLTAELAPQLLLLHVVFVGLFVAGHDATPVGLVLAAATALGLVKLIVDGQRAEGVIDDAVESGLQPYGVPPKTDVSRTWPQLVTPLRVQHRDVVRVKNLSYGEFGRRNRLDVYHHRDRPPNAPVLVQIHGGAWVIGSKEQQGRPLMMHLAARGWVCVSINYRLSPRSRVPDHLIDVKRAIGWTREHAADYGGDADFIVVTGGSAGGHLTALAALTANDPEYQPGFEDVDTSVRAAVPYYGVYDMTNELGTRYGRQRLESLLERMMFKAKFADDRAPFDRYSPLVRAKSLAGDTKIPPFFVIHGRNDSLVPVDEARHFVAALRAASDAPVLYAELPGAQHAFDIFPSLRTAHVIRGVERFLAAVHKAHASR